MYIKSVKRYGQGQLFAALQMVRLMGNNSHVLPYERAKFEIKMANPAELQPSALYVMRRDLSFLAMLTDELAEQTGEAGGLDTLIEYTDEFGAVYRMVPPVVEYSDFGEMMILDGEHRSYIAKHRGVEIPMLFISNVAAPYPCLALPDGWGSVEVVEEEPDFKRFRRPGLNDSEKTRYDLHRDLTKFGSRGTRYRVGNRQ